MDEDTTGIRVPIKVRSHELNQAHEFITKAVSQLSQIDATAPQEQAEELREIYTDHVHDVEATYPEGPEFAAYLSMPADSWRTVLGALGRLRTDEGLRSRWFRAKLTRRLRDRLEEME